MANKMDKLNLYNYVAGKSHPYDGLKGVYNDPDGYEVATESHILVYRKADIPQEKRGKIVRKDGTFIESKYPNWKAVVPSKDLCSVEIDLEKFKEFEKQWKAEKKEDPKMMEPIVCVAGACFSIKLLALFCRAMQYAGTTKAQIQYCYDVKEYGGILKFGSLDEGFGGVLCSVFPKDDVVKFYM